jgi:hypothetical protein
MSVTRELGILTHMPDGGAFPVRRHFSATSHGSDLTQILDQIVDLACSDHRMSLHRFVLYKHAWVKQHGECSSSGDLYRLSP